MKKTEHQKNMGRWAERRKLAYSLHHERGMSFSQIGKQLRITPQRVGQLVQKERDRRGAGGRA